MLKAIVNVLILKINTIIRKVLQLLVVSLHNFLKYNFVRNVMRIKTCFQRDTCVRTPQDAF